MLQAVQYNGGLGTWGEAASHMTGDMSLLQQHLNLKLLFVYCKTRPTVVLQMTHVTHVTHVTLCCRPTSASPRPATVTCLTWKCIELLTLLALLFLPQVALQFPEGLLLYACAIADILQDFAGQSLSQ
jgi:hypothetical protein